MSTPEPRDLPAQYLDRVVKLPDLPGCWLWIGHQINGGYGQVGFQHKQILTHRLAWECAYGPIPAGLFVCHKCDTPCCVRPDHLFLGTPADNTRDMLQKGRRVPPDVRGEAHGQSKLTDEKVKQILASVGTHRALARVYGISETVIGEIRRGLAWRHIQREAS